MPVYDIYSRRKKRSGQTEADVYQYDTIPNTLRIQIQHIWRDAIGPYYDPRDGFPNVPPPHNNPAWNFIRDTLCREKGRLSLAEASNPKDECFRYLRSEGDVDSLLDVIELSFRYIGRVLVKKPAYELEKLGITQDPEDAVNELNFRMREAGVGFQFEGDQIIRVDSELVHAEVVQPALQLLSDSRFEGAEQEFLAAHAHYRAGEYKDCVSDALNAFESTMKTICDIKDWEYKRGARASDLVRLLRKNRLLPDYLDNSFDQLIATLSSGLPKVRNEEGGHGQGAQPRETPGYVAAYALHLAAAKIVLLVEAMSDGA